ncbi:site-specific DNA-methyltransferase [Mycoplasmopsis bovis]|nr:site-specific DNA-methyltransferase [Mycoplasmopsis bovis]
MNRRYIGIEQMDYIQDITVERLKKVIDGEQGGISKLVNWQGGGSFVYCELLENSQKLINEVQKAWWIKHCTSQKQSILWWQDNSLYNNKRVATN